RSLLTDPCQNAVSANRRARLLCRQRQLPHLFQHRKACPAIVRERHRRVSAVEEHIQVRADTFEAAAVPGDLILLINLETVTITGGLQLSLHSPHRTATSGSTFVARRAGIQQASNATNVSSSAITTNVSGSVALTPYSKLFIRRVAASAASKPIITPANASFSPCPTTSFKTSADCAPRAIRMPISRVR